MIGKSSVIGMSYDAGPYGQVYWTDLDFREHLLMFWHVLWHLLTTVGAAMMM